MSNEKVIKAIENLNHVGFNVLTVDVPKNTIMYERPDGTPSHYNLDTISEIGWCPYCDGSLIDGPICSDCGDVSGKESKFYEKGILFRIPFEMKE